MVHGKSNGHVTDDVTWPWKVKLVIPIRLISKTAGYAIWQQWLIILLDSLLRGSTVQSRRPYNVYCVGGDVLKPSSIYGSVLYQVLNKQVPVQVPVLGKQVQVQTELILSTSH